MSLLTLPVPKSLGELVFAMEQLHTPRGPYVNGHAPTGEPFTTFRPTPQPAEGLMPIVNSYFLTKEAAIRAFWFEFIKYSATNPVTKLYWRAKPLFETRHLQDRDDLGHAIDKEIMIVRSRFLLSNKPIKSREYEEECLGIGRRKAA